MSGAGDFNPTQRRENVKRLAVVLFLSVALGGCATFSSIGWVDLPDGTRLKAVKVQVDTVVGTDVTHTMVYHCPGTKQQGKCVKDAEFGGASSSLLKAALHGSGAGAAIGIGLANQDADRTNVSNSASSKGSKAYGGNSNARAVSKSSSRAKAVSKSRSSSRSTSTSMGMMGGGGGD